MIKISSNLIFVLIFSLLNGSLAYLSKKTITSYYGLICLNSCEKYGYKYSWCKTASGWDYCSEEPTKGSYGGECNSICSNDDGYYRYKYCNLKNGGWDYCGTFLLTSLYQTSYQNEICQDFCVKGNCHNSKGDKIKCSPWKNIAINSDVCTNECDFGGYDYLWCWTEGGKYRWNYCSYIDPDYYKYEISKKRAIDENNCDDFFREVYDTGNLVVTRFIYETAPFVQVSQFQMQWASQLISSWDGIIPCTSSTIISNYVARLDLQGFFYRNGVRYANIQLQINALRSSGSSTTFANIFVPVNYAIPMRYLYYSLFESMKNKKRVVIEKQPLPSTYRRRLYKNL